MKKLLIFSAIIMSILMMTVALSEAKVHRSTAGQTGTQATGQPGMQQQQRAQGQGAAQGTSAQGQGQPGMQQQRVQDQEGQGQPGMQQQRVQGTQEQGRMRGAEQPSGMEREIPGREMERGFDRERIGERGFGGRGYDIDDMYRYGGFRGYRGYGLSYPYWGSGLYGYGYRYPGYGYGYGYPYGLGSYGYNSCPCAYD